MKSYLNQIKPYVLFNLVLFIVASALGYIVVSQNPGMLQDAVAELEEVFNPLFDLGSIEIFLVIFLNNALKVLMSMLLGVLLGLAPLFFIFINGYIFGIIAYSVQQEAGVTVFMMGILPHGIIELPVAFTGAGIGLMLGAKTFKKFINKKDISIKQELKVAGAFYLKLLLPLLFIAALIEVFITPDVINLFL